MEENLLVKFSKEFAIEIISLCNRLKAEKKESVLITQLLKSGTSIGANIHEGNFASSKADCINKFQIALKECYETDYWLEIFKETKIISQDTFSTLNANCSKLRKILTASIKTAKEANPT